MLNKKQLAARDGKITASFAPSLMAGDKDKILSEWRRLVGDPQWQPEDLSDVWPVQFGSYIEKFALDWHQKKTNQKLTRRGEVVVHPRLPYVSCTLDAMREIDSTVIDCKAPGAYRKIDDVVSYYTPQMIVQRACVQANYASLLIVHGGSEPNEYPVPIDPEYEMEVWARIDQFWQCVETLTPPFDMPSSLAPVAAIKTYDMSTDNRWCVEAGMWLATKGAAKQFAEAAKIIKERVPADAAIAHGSGIVASRNKAGSISIKEGN